MVRHVGYVIRDLSRGVESVVVETVTADGTTHVLFGNGDRSRYGSNDSGFSLSYLEVYKEYEYRLAQRLDQLCAETRECSALLAKVQAHLAAVVQAEKQEE